LLLGIREGRCRNQVAGVGSLEAGKVTFTVRSLPNLNNGYFELAFASVGRKLTAYVNGWLILEVDDDTPEGTAIQAGLPGLAASWIQGASTGLYKDVEIQILDNLTADRPTSSCVAT
jgi:hypothetical protein